MHKIIFSLSVLAWGQVAMADTPRVMTDIAPVQSLVAMVMGDTGAPGLLLPQGADPHDFQLRPSQAQNLAAADLVVWIGPEMTPWLDRALEGLGGGVSLGLLAAPETLVRGFPEGEAEAAADTAHDHAPHDHDHEGLDPHAWLEPENARIWLGLIAEALAKADPELAVTYRANAEAARARIDGIEAEVRGMLDPVKDKPFVVMHDAYGYFADHFGLRIVGALREGDAALPGAAHLAGLEQAVQQNAATCIFTEVNHEDASARQLAEATGARLGGAQDPEGTMLEPGPALYGALMRGLAATFATCLSAQ